MGLMQEEFPGQSMEFPFSFIVFLIPLQVWHRPNSTEKQLLQPWLALVCTWILAVVKPLFKSLRFSEGLFYISGELQHSLGSLCIPLTFHFSPMLNWECSCSKCIGSQSSVCCFLSSIQPFIKTMSYINKISSNQTVWITSLSQSPLKICSESNN